MTTSWREAIRPYKTLFPRRPYRIWECPSKQPLALSRVTRRRRSGDEEQHRSVTFCCFYRHLCCYVDECREARAALQRSLLAVKIRLGANLETLQRALSAHLGCSCLAQRAANPRFQCCRRSPKSPSQPSLGFELGQIHTGRRIPSACGVSGAELLCDFLVAVRNAQWRVSGGIALLCNWRMPRIHQSRSCRGLSRPLRRRGGFCHFRFRTPRDSFAAAPSGFSALVRVNPCGHSGRVGLGFVAYRNTFFPRYALG